MQYRGVEYRVRRTLSPDGWKWSVKFGDREKVGLFPQREGAIRLVQKFIDELIGHQTPLQLGQKVFPGEPDGKIEAID